MKKSLLAAGVITLLLGGCSNEADRPSEKYPSSMGQYHQLYIPVFANVVNGGTSRQATGNFFIRHEPFPSDRAIEVPPGGTFVPDLPNRIPEGYEMQVLLQ